MQIPFTIILKSVRAEFVINENLMHLNSWLIFDTAVEIMPEIKTAQANVESAKMV